MPGILERESVFGQTSPLSTLCWVLRGYLSTQGYSTEYLVPGTRGQAGCGKWYTVGNLAMGKLPTSTCLS